MKNSIKPVFSVPMLKESRLQKWKRRFFGKWVLGYNPEWYCLFNIYKGQYYLECQGPNLKGKIIPLPSYCRQSKLTTIRDDI